MPRPSGRMPRGVHRDNLEAAGQRLLETYTTLASRGEHLLLGLLAGKPPRQWQHYPEDDAIDHGSGYQWFYHSHSPEDRPAAAEHGHFHLFARRQLWTRRLQSSAEKSFASLTGHPTEQVATRHLLCIGLSPRGLPINLFTVNSWVTGDLMLSAAGTSKLLAQMTLDTGHPHIDTVIEGIVKYFTDEIEQLLAARDRTLTCHQAPAVLANRKLEVLSETAISWT